MTTIIEIPAQKTPKQLSARSASQSLHEHFLAFLNANNREGFSANDEFCEDQEFSAEELATVEADTIVELLISASQYDIVPEWKFKVLAKRLKKTSGGAIKHGRALEIVSRVFGYSGWYEASKVRKNGDTRFRNRRNRTELNLRQLLGLETTL